MTRPIALLSTLVIVLCIALGVAIFTRPADGMDEAEIRRVVAEILDGQAPPEQQLSAASVDPATVHPMIESYLMANPQILERMSIALRDEQEAESRARARVALAEMNDIIYEAENPIVLGNPNGSVTLVEMFDYNCGYCRQAVPDLAALIDENPELKVILKEFPILSQELVDAARIAIAAHRQGIDYWAFHSALFSSRGQVDKQAALDAAAELGLNPVSLELEAQSEDIGAVIQRSYEIAQGVGTTGTPTYIIGDEVIPGAIGKAELQLRIENMQACGSTRCDGQTADKAS